MTEVALPVLPRRPRSDYIDRKPGAHTNDAKGWFQGYPKRMPLDMRAVVEVVRDLEGDVLDRTFRVTADKRLAEHVGLALAMIQEVGYPLIGAAEVNVSGGKQGGVGSYANRAIKTNDGREVPSEHSRAKAWDLWTRSNPQRWSKTGKPIPFASTWHPLAVRIVVAGDFEWGGHFHDMSRGRYIDAMHIQYRLRPENVAASTARMIAEYEAIMAELEPEQPPEEPDVTIDEIKALQRALNAVGTNPALVVDGDYGALTKAAVDGMPALVASQVAAAEADAKDATKDAAVQAVSSI